jgi:2-polyprenyl-6-methoxyphenol hydroxylase-like FAD-dependent oxidoreductase
MRQRHAVIAGAGIGGLTAAAALAQRGWSVEVHERAPELRAVGAGIFLGEGALRMLEAIGALDLVIGGCTRHYRRETRDQDNKVVGHYLWPPEGGDRIYIAAREKLMMGLRTTAERAGAKVVLNSKAVGARADGRLMLEGGEERQGDIVIGADGVNSRLRDMPRFEGYRKIENAGAIRSIVPQLASDRDLPPHTFAEYWSGTRRIYYAPISPSEVFIALMTTNTDLKGSALPVDKEEWIKSFPHLKHMVERIVHTTPWAQFQYVRLKTWHQGRVVLIGDAAHAMVPNFGQGGSTAMIDAVSLAASLNEHADIDVAINKWEDRQRPAIGTMQRVSQLYGKLSHFPRNAQTAVLWLLNKSTYIKRQRTMTSIIPEGILAPPQLAGSKPDNLLQV